MIMRFSKSTRAGCDYPRYIIEVGSSLVDPIISDFAPAPRGDAPGL